jgi:hypothetical protein
VRETAARALVAALAWLQASEHLAARPPSEDPSMREAIDPSRGRSWGFVFRVHLCTWHRAAGHRVICTHVGSRVSLSCWGGARCMLQVFRLLNSFRVRRPLSFNSPDTSTGPNSASVGWEGVGCGPRPRSCARLRRRWTGHITRPLAHEPHRPCASLSACGVTTV